MRVHWQLKGSVYAIILIFTLAGIPLGLSLILQVQGNILFATLMLTPVLLYLMLNNIRSITDDQQNSLSWQDGIWTFSNETISIQGKKTEQCFCIGAMILLSIEDNNGKRVDLWLFPDSIADSFSTGFVALFPDAPIEIGCSNSAQGWRHLHGCFNLSKKDET